MADMPRRLYEIECADGALLLNSYLWGWVPTWAKLEGGPHWVHRSVEDLAALRSVDKRTIDKHLRHLRGVRLIESEWIRGLFGVWLWTPSGYEDKNQPPDRVALQGDRRSFLQRSPIDLAQRQTEIADRSCGDRRSSVRRSPIVCADSKEEAVKQLKQHAAAAAAQDPVVSEETRGEQQAAARSDLRLAARSLLTELAASLAELGFRDALSPADPQAVALLAALLDVPSGDDDDLAARRDFVRDTVLSFAAVCAKDPSQIRFLGGGMFSLVERQGRRSWWASTVFTVTKHRQLEAAALEAQRMKQGRAAEAARDTAEAAARTPRTESDLHALASEVSPTYAATYASAVRLPGAEARRRQGEVRELAELRDETATLERAREAAQDQAAALLETRRLEARDLDDLEALGLDALTQRRQEIGRKVAEALVRGDDAQAATLSQEKLAVTRRLALLRGRTGDLPQERADV